MLCRKRKKPKKYSQSRSFRDIYWIRYSLKRRRVLLFKIKRHELFSRKIAKLCQEIREASDPTNNNCPQGMRILDTKPFLSGVLCQKKNNVATILRLIDLFAGKI